MMPYDAWTMVGNGMLDGMRDAVRGDADGPDAHRVTGNPCQRRDREYVMRVASRSGVAVSIRTLRRRRRRLHLHVG